MQRKKIGEVETKPLTRVVYLRMGPCWHEEEKQRVV